MKARVDAKWEAARKQLLLAIEGAAMMGGVLVGGKKKVFEMVDGM